MVQYTSLITRVDIKRVQFAVFIPFMWVDLMENHFENFYEIYFFD